MRFIFKSRIKLHTTPTPDFLPNHDMAVKTLLNHIKRVADQTFPSRYATATFFKCTFS